MSYFGASTPHQELLESVECIQRRFNITDADIIVLLLNVTSAIIDPGGDKSDELRTHKEN